MGLPVKHLMPQFLLFALLECIHGREVFPKCTVYNGVCYSALVRVVEASIQILVSKVPHVER